MGNWMLRWECKCENIIIMKDFNRRFGQDAHVKHMHLAAQFADSVETKENEIHLLSFCEGNNSYYFRNFFGKTL